MKKIIFTTLVAATCILTSSDSHAQSDLLKKVASGAAQSGAFDVKSITNSLMGQLIPQLNLTNAQQPGVQDALSGFLTQKAGILPLQQSNPASYTQKQAGLFNQLKTKLGGILVQQQMNKFLGLKPAKNDPANVLSQLFF